MRRSQFLLAAVALCCFCLHAAGPKKIVFVAGPKDHGPVGNGRHEYEKDLTVLKHCLDHSENVFGITTKMYTGKVPDIAELRDAAVIVLESSGDRTPTESHVLFPQNASTDQKTYDAKTMAYLIEFDKLMKKRVGLVAFHYTTWVENETGRKLWADWLGGYFLPKVSKTMQSTWSMALTNEKHPILRGIQPWTYDEEIFGYERLIENPRPTPLIIGTPKKGESSIASWALERKGGGRGFVMTGVDWHKNLALDNYRRLLLNGIVWAARMKVPAGGVQCSASEELMK